MQFNLVYYMLDVAIRLKDVGHTTDRPAFARIKGITALEEFLMLNNIADTCLLPIDNLTGRFNNDSGDSDNLLDRMFNHFYILKRVNHGDYDDQQAKIEACKQILYKITAKMKLDRFEHLMNDGELAELILGSFTYDTIGPIGDNYHGLSVSFELINNLFDSLQYDANEWIEIS